MTSLSPVLPHETALLLSNDSVQKGVGWILLAILAPLILVLVLLCSVASGAASHNTAAVYLCFEGGAIPASMPADYKSYVEDMQASFSILDNYIDSINGQTEDGNSLDSTRVKAVFYALFFGEDSPSRRAHRQFVDCFVRYEEREVSEPDIEEAEDQEPATHTVAIPLTDLSEVHAQLADILNMEITSDQLSNADSIYSLIHFGWTGGSVLDGEIGGPVLSVDGFCSPLGSDWRSRITSDFGYRLCPYHGQELHSGLDMAAALGTPIRAALSGTVIKSYYQSSLGNYTVIDHGNGMTTGYAHQAKRLVKVGDVVEVGQVIGLVGSTGNSTGAHLHLEVRVNGTLHDPKNYLP